MKESILLEVSPAEKAVIVQALACRLRSMVPGPEFTTLGKILSRLKDAPTVAGSDRGK